MITYLIGGPEHGTTLDVEDRAQAYHGSGEEYRKVYVATSWGHTFAVFIHQSLSMFPNEWDVNIDSQALFDAAFNMIQTEHHNNRAGRV